MIKWGLRVSLIVWWVLFNLPPHRADQERSPMSFRSLPVRTQLCSSFFCGSSGAITGSCYQGITQTGIGPSCAPGVGTLSSELHKSSTHRGAAGGAAMIAVTTASRIGGYYVAAYKGAAEGETYGELLKSAGC
jgi:hypothetical protein